MDTGFVRQGGQHGGGRRGADEGKQQFRKHDHYQDTSPRKWSSKRRSDRASSLRTFFSHRDAWVNFYDELAAGLSGETPPAQLEKSFGLMMQNYCYTSAQVRDLLDLMHRTSGKTGLKPSAIVYTILISQLQIEGDVDAARAVLHVEMKDKGIPVDDAVMDTLDIDYDGICRRRNSTIKKMLESGLEGRQAAEKLYTTLENQGRVDARVLGSMMHLPLDSDGQRALLERAMTNGTIPNVVAWSILAKQLMIEGDTKAARTVANVEMWSNAGLRKDKRLRNILQLQGVELAKLRTARLVRLLRTSGGSEGRAAADVLFAKIIAADGAVWQHYNVMMKAALDSTAARSMLEQMAFDGISPDVSTYNTLIGHLAIEGDPAAIAAVVNVEMPAAGVVPDARTNEITNLGSNALVKRRRSAMAKMLTAGADGEAAAEALLHRLEKTRSAHSEHYRFVINHFGKQVAAAAAAADSDSSDATESLFTSATAIAKLDHWFERSPFIRQHKLERINERKWKVVLHGASRHLSFARLRALRAEFEAMPAFAPVKPLSLQAPYDANAEGGGEEEAGRILAAAAADDVADDGANDRALGEMPKPAQLYIGVGRGDRSGTGTRDTTWQRTSQASSRKTLKSQVSRWLQKHQIRYRYTKRWNAYEIEITPSNIAKFKRT